MLKRIAFGGIGLSLLISPLFVSADAISDLQAQIQTLHARLAALQAKQGIDSDTPTGGTSYSSCPILSLPLQRGSRDVTTKGQVTNLQVWLADYYGLNEDDVVTGYFGKTTESYVIRFQQQQGLPAFGLVGPATRAKIAQVCSAGPIVGAPSITVTAPNGGEQWEIGQLNTITWAPYDPNNRVNHSGDVNVFLERLDGSTVGQIMDTGKASLHTYFNIGSYNNWAEPGRYRVYVSNRVTGAVDRSDAPFTLLPRAVDIKVNGSDGPVSLADNQPVTVTYTTTGALTSCTLTGLRLSPNESPSTVAIGVAAVNGSISGYAYAPTAGVSGAIYATCYKAGGSTRGDSVQVNIAGGTASSATLQILSPNGGVVLDLNSWANYTLKFSGVKTQSVALYKNDTFYKWIFKDNAVHEVNSPQMFSFMPSQHDITVSDANAGAVWKLYVTALKSDGTGYVDDKSDAPFSFVASTPTPTPTPSTNSTNFIISSDTQNVNLYVLAGSPATAGTYTFTINSGITVGSGSTANAAISSGVWPAGSTVTLINNGKIYGKGGNGGAGGSCTGNHVVVAPLPKCTAASAGGDGGSALSVNYNITLNNTNGSIFGGGGGGGGAGGITQSPSGGGGGGGGQGVAASNGGAGGTAMYPGSAGHSGTATSPGVPGKNSQYGGTTIYKGGSGGTWASVGGKGEYSGAAGGAAGKAILLNGKTITWQGGNDATHVKGAVQ